MRTNKDKENKEKSFSKFMSQLAVWMSIPVWILCYYLFGRFNSFIVFVTVELVLVAISSYYDVKWRDK